MLTELFKQEKIDMFYADESGFDLTPSVGYGWQKKGETVAILSRKSKRTSVFGIYSVCNELYHYTTTESINSEFVINALDDFCIKLKRPTALILDNAPIHKSRSFMERIEQWMERDLYVYFLPKYSPHLNLIETLWRKIKYEWLPISAYRSEACLRRELHHILDNLGGNFSINFNKLFGTI